MNSNLLTPEIKKMYPYCIQVELTEGCNRRCWFCGLLNLPKDRQEGINHMPLWGVRTVFTDLSEWLPKMRAEVNSHGEPTLHPEFFEAIAIMREVYPKLCINLQTNTEYWATGTREAQRWIDEYWAAGGNVLVLNAYKKGLYEWWVDFFKETGIEFIDYYFDNPKRLSANRYYAPSKQLIFLWHDLGTVNTDGTIQNRHQTNKFIHNSGGNSNERVIVAKTGKPIRPLPWAHKCSKVFRELILGWDGTVPICCQDWLDLHVMGNAFQENIRDIWFNTRFNAVRQLLYDKRRDLLRPCSTCNDPTTRVGLLKNPGIQLSEIELLEAIKDTSPAEGKGIQPPIVWPK